MQEHPVPQDVTGYQFHIVGNMTLKQFAEVGVGAFIGFLIYTTNLPDFIKWPFVALAVALGAGAAFVPIEERPLDHWIVTFFSVMYRPTKYFWKREPKLPDPFLYKPKSDTKQQPIEVDLTPARRQRIKDFMVSLRTEEVDAYEQYEENKINNVMATFQTVTAKEVAVIKQAEKPSLQVRVRELKSREPVNFTTKPIAATDHLQTIVQNRADTQTVAENVAVPEVAKVNVQAQTVVTEETQVNPENRTNQAYSTQTATTQAPAANTIVATNRELPFPEIATEPNKPMGMVVGPNNEILANTIIDIMTPDGNIARAVKTNSLGQFFINTPLANGSYIVSAEKQGFAFQPVSLELNGEIVPPFEIRGQSAAAVQPTPITTQNQLAPNQPIQPAAQVAQQPVQQVPAI